MFSLDIDLFDELMSHHLITPDPWTVENMDHLIAWLKTQLHEGQEWVNLEVRGVPLGIFYALVKATDGL